MADFDGCISSYGFPQSQSHCTKVRQKTISKLQGSIHHASRQNTCTMQGQSTEGPSSSRNGDHRAARAHIEQIPPQVSHGRHAQKWHLETGPLGGTLFGLDRIRLGSPILVLACNEILVLGDRLGGQSKVHSRSIRR